MANDLWQSSLLRLSLGRCRCRLGDVVDVKVNRHEFRLKLDHKVLSHWNTASAPGGRRSIFGATEYWEPLMAFREQGHWNLHIEIFGV